MDITSLKAQARDLERRGRTREALAMYRHALTSLEGTPGLLGELPLYVKAGDLYRKLDNPKAAVSLYETAGKIYAAHGSAKSVTAICAKVVGVMPERTHVYTRLVRIMLEHGHVAAARSVLLGYAEHAALHDTRAHLEQLADRTDEHLHPVLEMLVEMAERLERAGAPTESATREVPEREDLLEPEPAEQPADDVPDSTVEEADAEEEAQEEPITAEVSEPDDEETEATEWREPADAELSTRDAESPGEDADRDPFGQGLVLSDLASEIMAAPAAEGPPGEGRRPEPPDDSALVGGMRDGDATRPPPWIDFGTPAAEADGDRLETGDIPVAEEPERLEIDHTATPIPSDLAPSPTPPEAPPADPDRAEPATAAVPRERVRGNGVDWPADPGLPGRAARRRSPVGSVLLAVSEETRSSRRRMPWYVGGGVVVVLAAVAIVWALTRSGGPGEGTGTGVGADSGSVAADSQPAPAASEPAGAAGAEAPLTLRPDPALSVESLAVPTLDSTPVGGADAAPSGDDVTVVAIAGLTIEGVTETRIEGRTGYEVLQVLETGERVTILSLETTEVAGPGTQGEVRIDAAPDGTRMARLRVGEHEVEVRGVVSEAAMRDLVVRLAEVRTARG